MLPFGKVDSGCVGEMGRMFGDVGEGAKAGGSKDFAALVVAVFGSSAEGYGYDSSYKDEECFMRCERL